MKSIILVIIAVLSLSNTAFALGEAELIKTIKQEESLAKKINDLMTKGEYKKALDHLDNLSSTSLNSAVKISSDLTYATAVLDLNIQNKKYIEKAIEKMVKLVFSNKNLPEYEFILANLYAMNGDFDNADTLLQKACLNPNVSAGIKYRCENSQNITKTLYGKEIAREKINTSKICNEVTRILSGGEIK